MLMLFVLYVEFAELLILSLQQKCVLKFKYEEKRH